MGVIGLSYENQGSVGVLFVLSFMLRIKGVDMRLGGEVNRVSCVVVAV